MSLTTRRIEQNSLRFRTIKLRSQECECKTILIYRDEVPYEEDILCKPCMEWEFEENL